MFIATMGTGKYTFTALANTKEEAERQIEREWNDYRNRLPINCTEYSLDSLEKLHRYFGINSIEININTCVMHY